ncbi:hypothetical protein DAEQUDRAFT_354926 [Daedalea quercina L-15889]|uniref:RGS domain-containing protein n=1 Tax=Daedalea quercina L-15889 TaxID=1314783 RepID=A0A165TQS1_9APHY|nr:hypothetical protein DAEQUDRAFT_354926 [Daedalea quercina L-15889]
MSSSGPPTYPKPVLVSSQRAPGVPTALPAPVQSRPKTTRLRLQALVSLPERLLNPPPARGQVPTFGVIPRFEISLDDILDRKHLPPLGLKDFEEWLLFVEQTAENLYFILWLREYTQSYGEWVRKSRLARMSSYSGTPRREYRTPQLALPANPELSYSYSRAKRTFLTPNGDYELDVPSDILSPFHTSSPCSLAGGSDEKGDAAHGAWSQSTHSWGLEGHNVPPPDPAIFNELAEAVREMLTESLQRFVLATYNNVGTPRAVCGSAGGIVIGLAGSIPLIVNFAVRGNRWWRLAAIPGMWAGLTIFISAMYGVCMMIYVFGDLRQLRSFELVRPPISDPQPHPSPSGSVASLFQPRPVPNSPIPIQFNVPFRLRRPSSVPEISHPIPVKPVDLSGRTTAPSEKPKLTIITPASRFSEDSVMQVPQRVATRPERASQIVDIEIASVQYTDEDDTHDNGYDDEDERSEHHAPVATPCIEISEAYYDEHPAPEGPATASFTAGRPPLWPDYDSSEEGEMTVTAAFIHPFSYDIKGEVGDDVEAGRSIASRQPVDPFDFDALPPKRPRFATGRYRGQPTHRLSGEKADGKNAKSSGRISGAIHSVDKWMSLGPKGVLSRWQTRCSPGNVVRVHIEREVNGVPVCIAEIEKQNGWGVGWGVAADPSESEMSPTGTLAASAFTFPNLVPSSPATAAPTSPTVTSECFAEKPAGKDADADVRLGWTVRFRKVRAVPAFAAPLTPVLNPVVTRAQWEIVVRSALIATLVVCVVVGGLTGAPVPR